MESQRQTWDSNRSTASFDLRLTRIERLLLSAILLILLTIALPVLIAWRDEAVAPKAQAARHSLSPPSPAGLPGNSRAVTRSARPA
jgi:cytoskeletal protein RodZ